MARTFVLDGEDGPVARVTYQDRKSTPTVIEFPCTTADPALVKRLVAMGAREEIAKKTPRGGEDE